MTSPLIVLAPVLALTPNQLVGSPQAPAQTGTAQEFARVYRSDTPGVTAPQVITMGRVQTTAEMFRNHVTGSVTMEVTVGINGHVRDALITKSLDTTYDEQAVAAASRSLFEPGKLNGQPVPVRQQMTFSTSWR